ncbi:MAG: tRNA epoxyqueuosine(34) reductase QueG [Chloroflexota bacterium]
MPSLASDLKAYAREIGFHLVGITTPEPFAQAEVDITRWLREGHQGDMGWLNDARTRLATRPRELLPGARSLIMVGVSYRTEEPASPSAVATGRVARYAWGTDYHDAMKARLRQLGQFLSQRVGRPIAYRPFVDDGPLVERDAAVRAGLGFRGKNTNLLTSIGSFVFLGALLTDVELDVDQSITKDCGSCRLCIDACPTDALDEAYHLAAERCIAYLTIEHKGPMPDGLRPLVGDWVFGCDVCQDVCPHNVSMRNRPRGWVEFEPRDGNTRFGLQDLIRVDDAAFRERFKGTPIKRTKRRGLARNAAVVLGNTGLSADDRTVLEVARDGDPEPLVRDAAAWALSRPRTTASGSTAREAESA